MGTSRRCGTPVDLQRALLIEDYIVDDFGVEDFGEVGFNEGDRLLRT